MESVVMDRSSSYARTRFGSVDGGLLISKSFNTTRSSFLGRNNNPSLLNANFTSSLVHQPPLLPLPLPLPSTGTRSAFSQRPRYKKPRPTSTGAKNNSSCSKEPNNEPLYGEAHDVVIDKLKRMEVVASSLVCSVSSPPPSSVPMPRFSIPRGRAATATATEMATATATAAVAAEGNGGGRVDVCATDGLRRLLRI